MGCGVVVPILIFMSSRTLLLLLTIAALGVVGVLVWPTGPRTNPSHTTKPEVAGKSTGEPRQEEAKVSASPKSDLPPVATPASPEPPKLGAGFQPWLERLEKAGPAEAYLTVLREAAQRESPSRFLQLVDWLLRTGNGDARLAALQALEGRSGPEVVRLYKLGLADRETGIREITRHFVLQQAEPVRLEVLTAGLSSPFEEVRVRCFDVLCAESSKAVIPAMILAMGSNQPDVAAEAARQLATRLGPGAPTFQKSAEAQAWWEANAQRY
jgi:hypothetical protein